MGKRLLGIDYGSKRVGVAVSDPLNIIARGVTVIPNSDSLIAEIRRIAAEFDVGKIVVGMPLNLKGEKGSKAEEVERFIAALEEELRIEVVRQDERFTTLEAHRTLREMNVGKSRRRSRETIDEMASALILQGYLDRQGR